MLEHLGLDAVTCEAAAELGGIAQGAEAASTDAEVAGLVHAARRLDALSTLRGEDGGSGDAGEQLGRLRELLLSIAADVRVVLVALAVRLARLRLRDVPDDEVSAYARTCLDVYAPLAGRLGVRALKWELEDLAFRALDETTYKRIAVGLAERRVDREAYVDAVVKELGGVLSAAGITADVSGRPKHIYSIFRKMQSKHLDLSELFDLRAVRVLVTDVADCYAALGLVHTRWPHLPKQFDDYITRPKSNGYRSLHTAVVGPGGRTLEVQIRTHDMHERAEFGVAAHWAYKEGASLAGAEARMAWMRQMLDAGGGDEAPDDLLARLRTELLSERVYAVTPQGAIVDLPYGATPLDFAYAVHTDLGHQCKGARVNGALTPLNRALASGDQVDVLRDRKGGPSRDWLNPGLGFLRSPRARAKVRAWFRQQDFEQNRADGEAALARELRRLALGEPDRSGRERLAKRFNFARFEDLTAAVGNADVSLAQVIGALQSEQAAAEPRGLRVRDPSGAQPEVHALGIGNLLTQRARCCSPVPPEPVRGYVTRGRGITIHRVGCAALERSALADPERVIDIDWGEVGSKRYPVRIEVRAVERRALLRDITASLSNERVDVTALDAGKVGRDGLQRLDMTLEVGDTAQLGRILDRVRAVSNVVDARRVLS